MSQGNVPISLLLGSSEDKGTPPLDPSAWQASYPGSAPNQPKPIQNIISQFQTRVAIAPKNGSSPISVEDGSTPEVVLVDDETSLPAPQHIAQRMPMATTNSVPMYPPPPAGFRPILDFQPTGVLEQIKHFQTNFRLNPDGTVGPNHEMTSFQLLQWAQPHLMPSKTSINSIINAEEYSQPAPEDKKKRAAPKSDAANKRAKAEPKKAKTEVKVEPKKTVAKKKKTPEVTTLQEKPPIHPTMTTDKPKVTQPPVILGQPSFIEGAKEKSADSPKPKEEKEKEKEIPPPPIIALNIPLLDPVNPKPGQAEVVINVLKLAEDKYGWNVIHPNAKSAIDLMDEMLDDEDDAADEDDDDELQVVEAKANAPQQKKKEELSEEQLVKQHEAKMNRKVGKYDYEDPFIDDAELQWEEEITTTKEGFFVYWGPLVEDKTTSSTKKGAAKKR